MADEWKISTVAELQKQGVLLVEDGNHGEYRPRPDEFVASGVAFIRAADMDAGKVQFDAASKINERARRRITKGIGAPGDILLSHKGTVGKVAFVDRDAPQFVCSPQTTFWRSLDPNQLDGKYLYSFLRSPGFHAQLATRAGETDMAPYVSLTSQRGLSVVLPPITVQRAIANVLGTLDGKIELNQRMNDAMESMALALFKSWFVNFEPVRAKSEGRDTGLPSWIADLFPNSFRNSEIGDIPTGWRVVTLGEAIDLVYGKALKEENRRPGSVPVYGSNGQVGWHNEKLADGPGIIVGRKGNPGTIVWAPTDFFAIDTTFYVVPRTAAADLYFLYYALREHDLASLGADSAVPGLNRNMAYMSRQLIPPAPIQSAFTRQVKALFERSFECKKQSSAIAAIRDALLPKLVSGEMEIGRPEALAGHGPYG